MGKDAPNWELENFNFFTNDINKTIRSLKYLHERTVLGSSIDNYGLFFLKEIQVCIEIIHLGVCSPFDILYQKHLLDSKLLRYIEVFKTIIPSNYELYEYLIELLSMLLRLFTKMRYKDRVLRIV